MNRFRQPKERVIKPLLPVILLAIVLLLTPLATASAAPAAAGEIDIAALDATIEAQMAKHGLPGVALAVVEGDAIVYLQGYGSTGAGRPMTPQTPMFIGSQSKSFTALAIAQLAEQGKIDLDAPVQRYIPWFQVADADASAHITVNHLLRHTSGLSDAGYSVLLPADASPEEAVRSLAQARLTAPVGTKFQYFNLGYATLAYIVELVSGQSYADYVQEHILAPLEMNATSAEPVPPPDIAQGYTRLFGFAVPARQVVRKDEVGAGYIVSTAEDMARYAIAMMDGGAGLVSPQMARRMWTPGLGAYGLGWMIVDGGAKVLHGGANETFRTDVFIYPRQDRSFILLSNQGHQADQFISAAQLAKSVEAIVLGQTPPPVDEGWSVRWIGWALGALVIGLVVLHTRNFRGLRGWRDRAQTMTPGKKALDIGISFIIPTAILLLVFSQARGFYGDRFSLLPTVVLLPSVLPDLFILMLLGTLPDYIQGVAKLGWTLTGKIAPAETTPSQ